ncbi:MAG: hypothetical protein ACR2QU_02385 [Gammaproteobacteria bacterium]
MTDLCTTKRLAAISAFFGLFTGVLTSANAATVRQVGFNELVAGSEVVFHGQVTSVQSKISPDRQSVHTQVEFQVFETIVGDYEGRLLKLTFPAGSADGLKVVINGLRIPEVGEEGVYFVESVSQRLINPFYGWTQGQFLVLRDATGQSPRIMTADGAPVTRISATPTPYSVSISRGAALGVEFSRGGEISTAMLLNDFGQIIRETAEQSR